MLGRYVQRSELHVDDLLTRRLVRWRYVDLQLTGQMILFTRYSYAVSVYDTMCRLSVCLYVVCYGCIVAKR